MTSNELSETTLSLVKVGDGRVSDGNGLYLKPGRTCRESHGWRFDYSFCGKRKTLSLGVYPEVSLARAREDAQICRSQLAQGQNPSDVRKQERAQTVHRLRAQQHARETGLVQGCFEDVARRWFSNKKGEWVNSYSEKVLRRLELHAFPLLGTTPIAEVHATHVLHVCRRVQSTGAVETGLRVRELCSWVFQFAIAEGLVSSDPCRDLRKALKTPVEAHFPALLRPSDIATYLRRADQYEGSLVVRSALQLVPMLMVRPGELRLARWDEFDLDNGLWIVPSARLKRRKNEKLHGKPHLVHLPRQAIAILEDLFLVTGRKGYVFSGSGGKNPYMSMNTVNAALRRMGYCTKTEVTAHGFRATFRTLTVELLNFPEPVAEMQLAHAVKDQNGTAYNRAEFLEQRRILMQTWADYLEDLKFDRAKVSHPLLTEFSPVTLRPSGGFAAMPTGELSLSPSAGSGFQRIA